jgi:hypothetical protein
MDEAGKGIMKKLREWAGDLAKVAGNKRKCTRFSSLHAIEMFIIDNFLSIKAWSTRSNIKNLKRGPLRHQRISSGFHEKRECHINSKNRNPRFAPQEWLKPAKQPDSQASVTDRAS